MYIYSCTTDVNDRNNARDRWEDDLEIFYYNVLVLVMMWYSLFESGLG